MQRKALRYDKSGDQHYDYISAWIKSTRGSDPDASLYYLAAMLEGGEDARFIVRRMVILASEDVGNADPQALQVAVAAAPRGRARRAARGDLRARPGRDLPVAGAEVQRGGTRARRRAGHIREAGAAAAAGGAALRGLRGGAQARPRDRLRLPARPSRARQRPGAPARGRASTCASTSPARCGARAARAAAPERIRAPGAPRRRPSTRASSARPRSRCGRSCRSPRGRATSGARRWRCSTSSTTLALRLARRDRLAARARRAVRAAAGGTRAAHARRRRARARWPTGA